MAELRWMTATLDLPAASLDAATAFWRSVTGSGLSEPRGEHGELATLLPRDGDPYVQVQRVADGPGGVHLDLHTDDVPGFVEHATDGGATVESFVDGAVLVSPGGFRFCVVAHRSAGRVPSAVPWWGGSSLLDQVCLDMPASKHEDECRFWAHVTGWPHESGRFPEFSSLEKPADQPLRLLLQRLDDDEGPVRAHLDLSSSDRVAEVVRHRSLDAALVHEAGHWTVLRDPAGLEYCVTDRDPTSGVLPPP